MIEQIMYNIKSVFCLKYVTINAVRIWIKKYTFGVNTLSGKKTEIKNKKDIAGNRLTATIVVAFVGLFILMMLYRWYDNPQMAMFMYVFVMSVASVLTVLFAASVVWIILAKKKGIDYSEKTITPINVSVTLFIAAICAWIMQFYGMYTIKIFYLAIPMYVVLYMINTIFEKDFLSLGVYLSFAGVLSYFLNKRFIENEVPLQAVIMIAVFFAVSVGYIAVIFMAKKNKGRVTLGGKEITRIRAGGSYTVMAIAPVAYIALCVFRFFAAYSFRIGVFFAIGYIMVAFIYYSLAMLKK